MNLKDQFFFVLPLHRVDYSKAINFISCPITGFYTQLGEDEEFWSNAYV